MATRDICMLMEHTDFALCADCSQL